MAEPALRFLHSEVTLNQVKLERMHTLTSASVRVYDRPIGGSDAAERVVELT